MNRNIDGPDVTGIATANVVDLLRIRQMWDGNKGSLIRQVEGGQSESSERRMLLSNGQPFDETS